MNLTSTELQALTGASYRQVDYWCRVGYLEPVGPNTPGTGRYREFHASEVEVALLLRALGECGLLGSMGAGGSKTHDYVPKLIAHVRANGLAGDVHISEVLTVHLGPIVDNALREPSP